MVDIWVYSDLHLNHANILKFEDEFGKKFRGDIFSSVEEMNETIIENHNAVVKTQDKYYNLGDVFFGNAIAADGLLSRLNGHGRLILGNHDIINSQSPLLKHFEKIQLWWMYENLIFSHMPLREDQMRTRSKRDPINVHGHIHQNDAPTNRHINVCVEKTNYKPIHIDELIAMAAKL